MRKYKELRKLSPGRVSYRICKYRKDFGVTQEQLAIQLGISRATLARWEAADVKVSNVMLRLLINEGVL